MAVTAAIYVLCFFGGLLCLSWVNGPLTVTHLVTYLVAYVIMALVFPVTGRTED